MDPTHKAMLGELLQRATAMPVREAVEAMRVEPDVGLRDPAEHRADAWPAARCTWPTRRSRAGMRLPIDVLFCSLAREQGERAIGVVLSGMGSDGTLGLQAIKIAGRPDAGAAARVGAVRLDAPQRHRRGLRRHRRACRPSCRGASCASSAPRQRRTGARRAPTTSAPSALSAILGAAARAQQARPVALQVEHAAAPHRAAHGRARPGHDGRLRGLPARRTRRSSTCCSRRC